MTQAPENPTTTLLERASSNTLEFTDVTVTLVDPSGVEQRVELGLTGLVVGSDLDCDLRADDRLVSHRHLELTRTKVGVRLRDLESTNGTFVGQLRVYDTVLPSQATLRFGNSRLVVSAGTKALSQELSSSERFGNAVGRTPVMRALFATLQRAAESDASILLTGESGSGKGILAEAVHQASSRRAKPFVVFDCSAVAPALLESELFGHVAGAFSGADHNREGILGAADGGTLFLDELGELPLELQSRLLRAIESKSYRPVGSNAYLDADVRFIAATHRDLRSAISKGQFREDLYFRLAVITAAVPPVRERLDDLPLIIEHMLKGQKPPRAIDDIPPQMLRMLGRHDWPGNVRELGNLVTRLVLFPESEAADLLGMGPAAGVAQPSKAYAAVLDLPLKEARAAMLSDFELNYLRHHLKLHQGSVRQAASDMGISRQFLYRMMAAHGLRVDEEPLS